MEEIPITAIFLCKCLLDEITLMDFYNYFYFISGTLLSVAVLFSSKMVK